MIVFLEWLVYAVIFAGLWGLLTPALQPYALRTRRQMKLLARLRQARPGPSHLENLLYLVQRRYEAGVSVRRFLAWSFFLAAAVFLTVYTLASELPLHMTVSSPFVREAVGGSPQAGLGFALATGLLAGTVPYLQLRLRYLYRQVQAGYDLLEVIKTLARYTNMASEAALNRTAEALPPSNVLKTPLKLLAYTLAGYTYPEELQGEAERFVRAIGTTFAVSFVSAVLQVHRSGGDLRPSLLLLAEAMEGQAAAVRQARQEVSDAISMGAWGNLFVLLAICGGTAYLLTWPVYARLQFQTAAGVGFLLLILLTSLFSLVTSLFLSRPRLDYA